MDLNEYQEAARETARYPDFGQSKMGYPAMGLCGEAGEVMEIIKKAVREQRKLTHAEKKKLTIELGDALWYLSQTATEAGISLGWIAQENLKKLERRYQFAPERS